MGCSAHREPSLSIAGRTQHPAHYSVNAKLLRRSPDLRDEGDPLASQAGLASYAPYLFCAAQHRDGRATFLSRETSCSIDACVKSCAAIAKFP